MKRTIPYLIAVTAVVLGWVGYGPWGAVCELPIAALIIALGISRQRLFAWLNGRENTKVALAALWMTSWALLCDGFENTPGRPEVNFLLDFAVAFVVFRILWFWKRGRIL